MKRFYIFIVAVILVLFATFFFGCKPEEGETDYTANVSYYQTHQYVGENELFAVTISAGSCETQFLADGAVSEMKNFMTLTVVPLNAELTEKEISYAVIASDGEVSGTLAKDKFGNALTAELSGIDLDNLTSVKLYYDETETEIPLSDRLENVLTWQDILAISVKELADVISANTDENGLLTREICIKYIRNQSDPNSAYYWYVSLIGGGFNYSAVLIDPESGSILTKKL